MLALPRGRRQVPPSRGREQGSRPLQEDGATDPRKQKGHVTQYQHNEAFKLMLYRSKDGETEEWIWNSRDGVTPFTCASSEGEVIQHVEWFRDVFAPFYIPPVGSRIFVDLTPQRARVQALKNAHSFFANDPVRCTESYRTPEELADTLAKSYLAHEGAPDVLVVNSAMADRFRARVPARRLPKRFA